jgi:3-hydroxyisobutyrate dehydrogenase-like beta-hydroxyacid dehydrogenase
MNATGDKRPVGVLGLGNMGSALADRLLDQGHKVTVWNRSAAKHEAARSAGATVAGSVAEAARSVDVLITCLSDHQATLSVVQNDEVAEALRGKLLVQSATVTANEACELNAWAGANEIAYLDGAILAFPEAVRRGESIFLYSGPRKDFDDNRDVFAAFDAEPLFVNEGVGRAPILHKAVLSGSLGAMLAFFHGAAMCRAAGLPIELYASALLADLGDNLSLFTPMLASRRYDENIEATMEVWAAGHDMIVSTSEALGVDSALPHLLKRYFEQAIAAGYGEQEFPALSEILWSDSK